MNKVYFKFKPKLSKLEGERVLLKDIIYITCPNDIRENIANIIVYKDGIYKKGKITAIEVIELISKEAGYLDIDLIGNDEMLYQPENTKKENKVLSIIKTVFAAILLFSGSALAIMYFHSDVNMIEAHEKLNFLITNKKFVPKLLSISYSIGVGLGMAIFFDVFNFKNKKEKPGPLELEFYQNEKELDDYLLSLDEDNDEE